MKYPKSQSLRLRKNLPCKHMTVSVNNLRCTHELFVCILSASGKFNAVTLPQWWHERPERLTTLQIQLVFPVQESDCMP
jgi:hypothetical protein